MITEKQIAALKHLILHSKDADELTKKICFFLIEKSELLSRNVLVELLESKAQPKQSLKQVSYGIYNMDSSDGQTHLSEILFAMGTQFRFEFSTAQYPDNKQYGDYCNKYCVSVWFSSNPVDRESSKKIPFASKAIESIKLESGLYCANAN